MRISSVHNKKILALRKLYKSRERKAADVFIAEGVKEVSRGISSGFELKALYYCPEIFNQELKYLNSNIFRYKEDLSHTVNGIMIPTATIKVAVDDSEVVAFDEFIEAYREVYEEIGSYVVYELKRDELMKLLGKEFVTYGDVLGLKMKDLKELI